jgi:enoyl-CoA hydratase/carnithine racemase
VKAQPDEGSVLYELDDAGVATLTLNRPERKNGWTYPMEERYFDLLEQCGDDPDVRVIVVTGAGDFFCPGMDMQALDEVRKSGTVDFDGRRPQTLALSIPKPVIAAINGPAAGIGLLQALVCDIRFAAANAKFTTAFARRGLLAEHGIAWLLPRVVGRENAADLLFSARTVLAPEAKELGLVSRVVGEGESVLDAARAYARDLAQNCSPLSMAMMKIQMGMAESQTLEEARLTALPWVQHYTAHPDLKEGMASFAERRPARFGGLPAGFEPGAPY